MCILMKWSIFQRVSSFFVKFFVQNKATISVLCFTEKFDMIKGRQRAGMVAERSRACCILDVGSGWSWVRISSRDGGQRINMFDIYSLISDHGFMGIHIPMARGVPTNQAKV